MPPEVRRLLEGPPQLVLGYSARRCLRAALEDHPDDIVGVHYAGQPHVVTVLLQPLGAVQGQSRARTGQDRAVLGRW